MLGVEIPPVNGHDRVYSQEHTEALPTAGGTNCRCDRPGASYIPFLFAVPVGPVRADSNVNPRTLVMIKHTIVFFHESSLYVGIFNRVCNLYIRETVKAGKPYRGSFLG